jgi:hypothetical protein
LLINLVEVWRGQAAPELVSRWHSSWQPCSSFRLLQLTNCFPLFARL